MNEMNRKVNNILSHSIVERVKEALTFLFLVSVTLLWLIVLNA